jgi:hypothetical protein
VSDQVVFAKTLERVDWADTARTYPTGTAVHIYRPR